MHHAQRANPPAGNVPVGADTDFYRRQLETIAQNATLALFIMDEQQRCTYMNPAAERLTGYTLAEVQGRALHDVIHHTRPDGTPYPLEECPIDQAFPKNMREQGEEVFVHRDGHFYPVAFTASPIREAGRTVGTIIEVRDTTEEKAREEERERLIRDRERLLRELEVERRRLHQIFVHAPALISVTRGPDHVFELVNPFYQKMLGQREVMGKPLREALPELVGQGFLEMRDAIYASGEPHVQNEARILVDLDGDGELEEHFMNFVTQPLRDADGRVDGILTFAVDVSQQVRDRRRVEEQALELEAQTEELQHQAIQLEEIQVELEVSNSELQLANEELATRAEVAELASAAAEEAAARLEVLAAAERAARADAEAANHAKTEFLSAMSHELRTPLNAIAGYVDLLDLGIHGPLTDPQRTSLGRIKNAQLVLLSLISDILNFARIEAGRIEFRREVVSVSSLLASLEEIIEPQVRDKGLTYACDTGSEALQLLGDPERLHQILMNLISNAVKFTEPGGRVEVSAAADGEHVVIRVADSGRGIPGEKLETVFEPFVQLERQSSSSSQQGVGLGLAISRELAHGMGGTLAVRSEPGVGSTFLLSLPRHVGEDAASEA